MQEYLDSYDDLTFERKHEIQQTIIKIHKHNKHRNDKEKLFIDKFRKEQNTRKHAN